MTRTETLDFIGNIARDMGKPLYVMENYPSGYWLDFPPAVEIIMKSDGKDAAERYVRKTFRQGYLCNAPKAPIWRKLFIKCK